MHPIDVKFLLMLKDCFNHWALRTQVCVAGSPAAFCGAAVCTLQNQTSRKVSATLCGFTITMENHHLIWKITT